MTVFHTTLKGVCGAGASADIFTHSLGIESNGDAATVGNAIRDSWITAMQGGGAGMDQYYNSTTLWEEVTVAQVLDPMVPDLSAALHVPFTPHPRTRPGDHASPADCYRCEPEGRATAERVSIPWAFLPPCSSADDCDR